mgnify:CR=1 FL=1
MGKVQQMQEEMQKVRERLAEMTVTAEAGGGMVKVEAACDRTIRKITVDPDAMDDREMVEDLTTAAVNKALEQAEAKAQEEMAKVTKGMMPNIPGLDLSNLGM